MNWDAIGAIGEIVGALTVVATLYYLARQINDSTRQSRMASVAELNTIYNDSFLPIYNSPENMRIWVEGLAGPESLTKVELEIFFLFMRRLLNPFDTAVTQYHGQTLQLDHFHRYLEFSRDIVRSPGGQVFLESVPHQLTPKAREMLDLPPLDSPRSAMDGKP
jgi:hypothetical protein